MTIERTILITAAGGNIGSELVPRLLSTPTKLVLPTSNAARLQSTLPPTANSSNVAVEEGSVRDPMWIEALLKRHNVDSVFLCLTGTDELMTTLNFFNAMQRAGTVRQLVYLSACMDFTSEAGIQRLMHVGSAGHVLVKTTLEQKLAYADFPWETTILGPTLFFGNDLRSKSSMLQRGLFDEPLGPHGVSRVSPADIALVARNVFMSPGTWAGKKIMVGSRRTYTGAEVAGLWSAATERKITMRGSDATALQEFEDELAEKLAQMRGSRDDAVAWARDLRLMYEIFALAEFGMSEEEYGVLCEVLGKKPEDYEEWVRKTGESWRGRA